MNVNAIIIIVAILLCIATIPAVLCIPHIEPNQIEAIAESASAILTTASIIILVRQNRETAKQNTETMIRSEWAILHAERQRLESDVTQCRIDASSEVRGAREKQLSNRIKEVSGYMTEMLRKYPDVLPNLAYFTLQDKAD